MRFRAVASSLLVAVGWGGAWATPAWAGQPPSRKGFWMSFGLGYGSAHAACEQCPSGDRVGSVSGAIRLGGTLGPHWLLGWEGSGWLQNNATGWLPEYGGADRTLGNSMVVALFYPRSTSGFFVRGGAGLSYAGFSYGDCVGDSCYTYDAANGVGFGASVAIGYDLRIRPNKSLTPELVYARGFPRDLTDTGRTVATNWSHDYWAVNLCFTIH